MKRQFVLICFLAVMLFSPVFAQERTSEKQATTPVGTSMIWGTVDGVQVEGMVQGPSTEVTPLQIACVFEYTEGDIFNSPPALPAAVNGLVHLDHDLKGIITDLRKNGYFTGHAFETLLITPPAGSVSAKQVLLIGLGDRNKFSADLMTSVGAVAMREALKLGVKSYAFASDLKDAGVDSPTALVAANVVKGSFEAYRTQTYLKSKKMANYKPLTKITLLAGPAFYTIAGDGIKEAIASFKN
ncbi:M17 family peptidase N-terminal domain-containing protein [Dyadobacter sp. 3J3]|uniref:M17 family peptidase N-terminal domain-containing protein n=1 Tax=Dyadobacter sp. 3J3 TaxID=2606600 RepID=UPI001357F21A|nr:M17 family peptidase N-terminal domain-containing protein [Dyadobacter sp. 3J3]